jgi:hypothetical protein
MFRLYNVYKYTLNVVMSLQRHGIFPTLHDYFKTGLVAHMLRDKVCNECTCTLHLWTKL